MQFQTPIRLGGENLGEPVNRHSVLFWGAEILSFYQLVIMSTITMIMMSTIVMRSVSIRFLPNTAEEISWWTRNEPGPEITTFEKHQMKLFHNAIKY